METNNGSRLKYRFVYIAVGILVGVAIYFCIKIYSVNNQEVVITEYDKYGNKILDKDITYDTSALLDNLEDILDYNFDDYEILSTDAEKTTGSFNAIDTVIDVIIYTDDKSINANQIIKDTEKVLKAYEYLISKTIPTSFTYTLNENKEFDYKEYEFEPIVSLLTQRSEYYSSITKGKFDVTVEPLVALWDINKNNNQDNKDAKKPEQQDIDKALEKVGYENFINDVDAEIYILENDATVDFGAIAKGYATDIIKAYLMSRDIDSALINAGGNVTTIGEKPGGMPWVIGIQDPKGKTKEYFATIELKNMSAVTSGNYEKYFIQDGVRYHHIIDPETGYPGQAGLSATTIISKYSMDCDALSTSTFLLGEEEGMALINDLDGFEAMFITDDNEIVFSNNFEKNYPLTVVKELVK